MNSTMVGFRLDFGCLTSQPDFNHGTTLKSGRVPSGFRYIFDKSTRYYLYSYFFGLKIYNIFLILVAIVTTGQLVNCYKKC